MTEPLKIFVFCNSCSKDWHSAVAIAEDGHCLAGHVCSSHAFIPHDMGIAESGWKRDIYAEHAGERGFEVIWVEDPRNHAGLDAAYERNQQLAEAAEGDEA